jgi:hypothetical protein
MSLSGLSLNFPNPKFGNPKEAGTGDRIAEIAGTLVYPVHVTVKKKGVEGDPPETPCDDEGTLRRFLAYWGFRDGVDTAEVRTIRYK